MHDGEERDGLRSTELQGEEAQEEMGELGGAGLPEPAGELPPPPAEDEAPAEPAPPPGGDDRPRPSPGAESGAPAAREAELLALLKQLSADFENFRRRSEAQLRDARQRGQDRFLEELVPALVDLQAALDAPGSSEAPAMRDGIRMVLENLYGRIAALGYSRITARGERMDPARHDALFASPTSEFAAGTVLAELAPGFERDGRVVLAAKVSVAREE